MAARIKALVEPAMLVWARETASLSQEVAAHAFGVPVERIQEWERGDDSPTVNQLRRMAERYKRPLSVFYLPEPPQGFNVLRDFRRLPGAADPRFSPQLAYEVRAAYERRLVALDVLESIGEAPVQLDLRARPRDDPEVVGTRLRERLGVTFAQQNRWSDPDKAFRGWRDAIEAAGVLVFALSGAHHQVALEEMRGFAIADQPLPVIVVNGKDRSPGRIFTLLHELAHVATGQSAIENDIEPGHALPQPDRVLERFCNHVAAAALMPRELLIAEPILTAKQRDRTAWSNEEIVALARRYGVSREALLLRLVELGRADMTFYQTMRRQYAREREEAEEPEATGFAPYRYQVLGHLGRGFARLVLQGYHNNRLSLSAVSGYLGVQAKYVPTIERAAFGVPT
jgi:Zn-dependent peptidase ImmA (M78 family)/transcriptional regulator with XRE-family HTH domain